MTLKAGIRETPFSLKLLKHAFFAVELREWIYDSNTLEFLEVKSVVSESSQVTFIYIAL